MRSARMTVLMTPAEKAGLEAEAMKLGVSSGEYVRLAVDKFENGGADRDREALALLTREVEAAIPRMRADLCEAIAAIEASNRAVDAILANEAPAR